MLQAAEGVQEHLAEMARGVVMERQLTDEREYLRQVGRRVRLARTALDLSQAELAGKTGISKGWISAMERAKAGADGWKLGRLAVALEVPLGWLVSHSAEPVRVALREDERP